ncbi:AMP-binding protein [Actinomycetospora endophytica]|uniref:AMP-binding protein n=1 Tax=Actinomycetospora endophytica TaxID=2291215 RepID=A0ABS8PCA2_9PSEU|nr:AMP-binding protein [Actinomycetospora endophytica]MCD2195125.1 AMP-binding protein [Actinomycetospora endophytica]
MTLATDFTDGYRADMARRSWPGRTLLDHLDEAVAHRPDTLAVVGYTHADDGRRALTYAELAARVDRVAAGLLDLGVQAGQVVSMQLPNWWQLPVLSLACLRVGAVTNALMPIFRTRELEFMLGLAESTVLVVPEEFAGFDHAAMARDLTGRLPALTTVITVRPGGGGQFDAVLAGRSPTVDDRAEFARRRPDPDAVVQLAYTSGTTGEPKGVMVTSNTALCNVRDFAARLGLTPDDVQLMASPLAHQTGYMYGFQMPILRGATSVLQDVWRPGRAAEIIRAESVAFTMASTPFLADLTREAEAAPEAFASFRVFLCAGAPVPRDLVRRATVAMDARIGSGWGMSEMGAVTATGPEDADERVFETDGSPLPDVELRVIGLDGDVLGPDVEGSLQVRANSLFGGYLKRPNLRGCDAEGWFDTGDLARIDADGFLRITGRSKDIIIRGGENIPVVEIENLLYAHPDVAEVAIVAMPDERLGERACAFVVPREGAVPTLDGLGQFLARRGAATQYRPERLELVDALPRTLTGKIQKFRLRERLAAPVVGAGATAPREDA